MQFSIEREDTIKYAGLFYLDIDLEPDETCLTNENIVRISVNFGEERENTKFGEFKFGIRKGYLEFDIKGGEAPYKNRSFVQDLLLKNNISLTTSTESSSRNLVGLGISSDNLGINTESDSSLKTINTVDVDECLTTTFAQGSNTKPMWVFQSPALYQRELRGYLDEKLCKVIINEELCLINIRFFIDWYDVIFIDSKGILGGADLNNKRAYIERLFAKHALKGVLYPNSLRTIHLKLSASSHKV
jgi:hypothetical protein